MSETKCRTIVQIDSIRYVSEIKIHIEVET